MRADNPPGDNAQAWVTVMADEVKSNAERQREWRARQKAARARKASKGLKTKQVWVDDRLFEALSDYEPTIEASKRRLVDASATSVDTMSQVFMVGAHSFLVAKMREQGLSWKAIADDLNERGIGGPGGRKWTATNVRQAGKI